MIKLIKKPTLIDDVEKYLDIWLGVIQKLKIIIIFIMK